MQLFYHTWTHRGSLAPKSFGLQLFGATKEPVCNFLRYLDLFHHAAVSQSVSHRLFHVAALVVRTEQRLWPHSAGCTGFQPMPVPQHGGCEHRDAGCSSNY